MFKEIQSYIYVVLIPNRRCSFVCGESLSLIVKGSLDSNKAADER